MMKKLVVTLIAIGMLLGLGTALAQSSQSHGVSVTLPGVLMIRLVSGASNAAVPSPDAVVFNLSSYTAANFDPTGTYVPTPPTTYNWNDVAVFSNSADWVVTLSLESDLGGFDWSKVAVAATAPFTLFPGVIASGGPGGGFSRLGFGPQDFELTLDGTEGAGSYSVTVIYTIAAP
jgi:hypothetical protein